jgi:hypothetical protein
VTIGAPIVFVKYYDKGSTRLAGDQIAALLRERGHDAHSVPVSELRRFRDGVAVFIKTSRIDHLIRARLAGMLCVLDVHDAPCFRRRRTLKSSRFFHGMIFKNERQRRDFDRPWLESSVIWHQHDSRYRPHRVPEGVFRAGYLGEARSLPWFGALEGVPCVDEAHGWFEAALDMSCHLSVRRPGREWLYKPGMKVATAAACHAVLVTTPDESALEMLGADYPLYTAPDREAVLTALERARAAIGGASWRDALSALARVREQTTPARVIERYERYFEALRARHGRPCDAPPRSR